MKKILSIILTVVLLFTAFFMFAVSAESEVVVSREVIYNPDGSYTEIVVTEKISNIMPRAETYTKSGSKSISGKTANGNTAYTFTLHGTFTVRAGVSATCTNVSYSTSNIASGWNLDSASTGKSANKAIGNATFKYKVLLITTQTEDISVTLSCDGNGNLS